MDIHSGEIGVIMNSMITFHLKLLAVTALFCSTAFGAWSWPGCPDVTDEDFALETIIGKTAKHTPRLVDAGLAEPIEMELVSDGAGGVERCDRAARPLHRGHIPEEARRAQRAGRGLERLDTVAEDADGGAAGARFVVA